jgi:alginate O-acetyltransferase complex protein AlgI
VIFTSWAFVLFLAVVLIGLRLAPNRTVRQALLLLASCYFYAYWNPRYLLLLLTPSAIDYFVAIRLEENDDPRIRKRWLLFSLITNLGLLGYFKYADFFVQSFADLLGVETRHLHILLPVGISFYTFKTLSYVIDVYRREMTASRSIWRYAMFVTYFPELVAGPIVRASVFLPQMTRSLRPSWQRAWVGSQAVLLGFTKKLVIADRLAPFVDTIFAAPANYSPVTVLSAVIAYSVQIYCDFSGYSDIAIGVSRIIGYDLPENFNMPYAATSITDFWRRWHMTLSQWLRDYLYIPLGGNRKGKGRTYLNLFLTMLLGGLWHGANWTFVFWGFLHGVGLAVHKARQERIQQGRSKPLPPVVGWLLTYSYVCFAWVFFRAQDFSTATLILRKMLWLDSAGINHLYLPLALLLPLVLLGHWLGKIASDQARATVLDPQCVPAPSWAARMWERAGTCFAVRPHPAAGLYVLLPIPGFLGGFVLTSWILLIGLFAAINSTPFIYFQF